MTDLARLKRLAEAAKDGVADLYYAAETAKCIDLNRWHFYAAANPHAILDLISRLEEAEGNLAQQHKEMQAIFDKHGEQNVEMKRLTAQRDEAVSALGPFGSARFQDMPAGYPVQIGWTDGVNRGFSHNSVTTDDFRHAQDVVARLKGGE